jgi:hypothetical protein
VIRLKSITINEGLSMFFLLIFVFLFEIVFCAEPERDIVFINSNPHYRIGFIDPVVHRWKPFNKNFKEIQLKETEVDDTVSSLYNVRTIRRSSECITFIAFSYKEAFSVVAKVFENTNLDGHQKKYVSEILNAAEDLQSAVRKYTTFEMGEGIMPVLSDFITTSCEPNIFYGNDRLSENIRISVYCFLKDFDRVCGRCYFKTYEQAKIHPYKDVGVGLLLILFLYYTHKNNVHFIAGHHSFEKLFLVAAYGAFLAYDFKDRLYLSMKYQEYVRKYETLIDLQANNGYLFLKYAD